MPLNGLMLMELLPPATSRTGAVSPVGPGDGEHDAGDDAGQAVGSTILTIVFHFGHAERVGASRSALGTSRIISSDDRTTIGSIRIASASAAAKPEYCGCRR